MNLLISSQSVVLDALKVDADPVANFSVWDVGELDSDFATVRCFIRLDDVF